MRVVFLGTPDFAVTSLEKVIADGHEVAAVVTQPDRPAGRGKKLLAPPIKPVAEKRGITILQFPRIRDGQAIRTVRELQPDVCVTAAFGQILNREFLSIPQHGTINVHGSLLPKYRGPAPIQWAIINGETDTGITTMLTDEGVDTGDILLQRSLSIGSDETAGELFVRMADLGAEVLSETLTALEKGRLTREKQDEAAATRCPFLDKESARLDFSKPPETVVNLVRGTNPWPLAHTVFRGKTLRVHNARLAAGHGKTGEVLISGEKNGLIVACGEGALELTVIQVPGSRPMFAREFLRGRKIEAGTILGHDD